VRALLCTQLGSIDALAVHDLPSPRAGAGQVVVDVKASALNYPDALMVKGLYQVKPPLPFAPGAELAGVVKEVGEGVTALRAGDRVVGFPGYGGFAEEVVMPADRLTRLPDALAFDLGAAFGLAYCTSLHALQECARLAAGESLLVLGAAGGVGLAAVEIGKALGARVVACASTEDKLAACRTHGADETINYSTEDLRERIKTITEGRGVDVVYDAVGGAYTEPALRSTAWRGRLLVVGFAAGDIPKIPLNLNLLKGCSIVGVFWGDFVRREPERFAASFKQLGEWFRQAKLKPHVSTTLPLDRAREALEMMASRQVIGKVVLART